MGRITEIKQDMDGGFELTAEFGAEEIFYNPDVYEIFYNPNVYEINLGDVYDLFGMPLFNRRAHSISKYDIRNIYYNNKKFTTVVVWETGEKTKVKMADGESCYIVNAVSAAVMKRKYGSNSAFKAHVEKMLGGYNDSAYQLMARAESSEIYGGYEELFMLIADKLILQ